MAGGRARRGNDLELLEGSHRLVVLYGSIYLIQLIFAVATANLATCTQMHGISTNTLKDYGDDSSQIDKSLFSTRGGFLVSHFNREPA